MSLPRSDQILDENFGSYVNITPADSSLTATLIAIDSELSSVSGPWTRTGTNIFPTTAGDKVQFSSGSAASPGIQGVSDIDTGIFWTGDNILHLATAGIDRLQIQSDGKLELNGASIIESRTSTESVIRSLPAFGATTFRIGRYGTGATNAATFATIYGGGYIAVSSSADQSGTVLEINAGPGTGIGTPGYITMSCPVSGVTGTAVQTLTERMRIMSDGVVELSSAIDFEPRTSTELVVRALNAFSSTTLRVGRHGAGSRDAAIFATIQGGGFTAASATSNQAGTVLELNAGPGTGIGTPGYITMSCPVSGVTGTAVQTLTERVRIKSDGIILLSSAINIEARTSTEFVVKPEGGFVAAALRIGKYGIVGVTDPSDTATLFFGGWTGASSSINEAGTNAVITAGPGTGNSLVQGGIFFQTPNAGASGTALQAVTTKASILRTGEFQLTSVGTESLPAISIGNDTNTGWYSPGGGEIGFTSDARRILGIDRASADIFDLGGYGTGSTAPEGVVFRISGWEVASSTANQLGPTMDFYNGRGTGNAASGDIRWVTYTSGASGTAVHSAAVVAMTLNNAGNFAIHRSSDVQLIIGNSIAKPTSLVGAAIGIRQVTTEPTLGVTNVAFLYYQVSGDVFKYITPGGVVKTITAV